MVALIEIVGSLTNLGNRSRLYGHMLTGKACAANRGEMLMYVRKLLLAPVKLLVINIAISAAVIGLCHLFFYLTA